MQYLQETHVAQGNEMSEGSAGVGSFVKECQAEMKKVAWSTKEELVRYTVVVGVAVAVVCALIWICDTFFARLFHWILR